MLAVMNEDEGTGAVSFVDTDKDRIRLVTRWMALALGGGDMRRAEERFERVTGADAERGGDRRAGP